MSTLAYKLSAIQSQLPPHVTLVAVSKFQTSEAIKELYEAGQRDFGENYVQELIDKQALLPSNIRWHFIGHLQSNKVKYIAPFVHLIHGIDSIKLLNEVQKQAEKINRTIDVLLQIHVATEETKSGFSPAELKESFEDLDPMKYSHIRFRGMMGMATFTDNQVVLSTEFITLSTLFHEAKHFPIGKAAHFDTLSMGMSGDWELAIQKGSTMVRIGSAIFGERKK